MNFSDVRAGDTISLYKELKVSKVGVSGFYSEDNKYYPASKPWEIDLIKRNDPEHWPAQVGDVWLGTDGHEYFVFKPWGPELRAIAGNSTINIDIDGLKDRAVKLIHRKGNQ